MGNQESKTPFFLTQDLPKLAHKFLSTPVILWAKVWSYLTTFLPIFQILMFIFTIFGSILGQLWATFGQLFAHDSTPVMDKSWTTLGQTFFIFCP